MNTYQMPGDDRVLVLHTDHLACIAAVEGENKRLRLHITQLDKEIIEMEKDFRSEACYIAAEATRKERERDDYGSY